MKRQRNFDSLKRLVGTLKALGYERAINVNPPLHGSTRAWRGQHTMLSVHKGYLLFHYLGGNRRIETPRDLYRLTMFLEDSWNDRSNIAVSGGGTPYTGRAGSRED